MIVNDCCLLMHLTKHLTNPSRMKPITITGPPPAPAANPSEPPGTAAPRSCRERYPAGDPAARGCAADLGEPAGDMMMTGE